MKKVAVIIPKYGLAGGAEQFARILTDRLIALTGYQYHIFANRCQAVENNVVFHKVPLLTFPKFLTTVSFAYFAAKKIRPNNFSLVHSHERIFFADIFTMHGIPHRYWVENIRRKRISLFDMATDWVERRLVLKGNCRKFVAVSRLTKEIFLSRYDVSEEKIAVIHPGVDLPNLTGSEAVRRRMREELGIPADVPVMMFVSMNFEIKGLAEIIAALAELKKQKRNLRLVVVGKGNINKFRKAAAQAGVGQDIFFTGAVDKD
ncbi:MAG TPA: glycosyltransferase family 4 protein, partial [Smithellaceae bacterium]|nr:glycosyltransferase family 4 protein [Smithellaceae bacterium]